MTSRGSWAKGAELTEVAGMLGELSQSLSVPENVADEAAHICFRGLKRGLAAGRPFALVAVASIYAACREKEIPTTLDEIAWAAEVNRDAAAKLYRVLLTKLDLNIPPICRPPEYLAKVASLAGVSPEVESRALEILSRAEKTGVVIGSYPAAVAASALYVAAALEGEYITQYSAACAAGVAELTISKQYKRLTKGLELDIGHPPRRKKLL